MKKLFLLIILALTLSACKKEPQVVSVEHPLIQVQDSTYNANVTRTDLLLEGEELHEVFIITNDSAQITNHCDDCKYCAIEGCGY